MRLDLQAPYRPKAWPRSGIQANLWHWRLVMGYRWKEGLDSQINLYELLALFNSIKWRLRNAKSFGSRVLHLVDSQVVVAVCAKGRTGSSKLRGTLRRLNAWIIAGGLYPCFAYVNTGDNPADIPSRWAEKGRVRKKLGKSTRKEKPELSVGHRRKK